MCVKPAGAQRQTRAQIPAPPSTICVMFDMLFDSLPQFPHLQKNGAKCTDLSELQGPPKGTLARGSPPLAYAKCAVGISQHFLPRFSVGTC